MLGTIRHNFQGHETSQKISGLLSEICSYINIQLLSFPIMKPLLRTLLERLLHLH